MRRVGILVLAAGGSSRLGRPKQLLPYDGGTLVGHAVRVALASDPAELVIVIGAEADSVRTALSGMPGTLVFNSNWQEGIGSSIRIGITAFSAEIECAVVVLADQPKISAEHLRRLSDAISENSPVAASTYAGVIGAPCAFARSEFAKLQELRGDAGARSLLRNEKSSTTTIPFEEAMVDVDTMEDYLAL
jgi:molybdenum cofactor cytidylyltransferase